MGAPAGTAPAAMNCATHPDVAAMGVCRSCGRPVCPLCVYFDEGALVCADHRPAQATAAPQGGTNPAGGPSPTPTVPVAVAPPLSRLDPLPMALRPGWPDEPAVPRPGTGPETLGLIGLVVSVLSLPLTICCGIGAVAGAPLALIGGGLGLAAVIRAPRARNPQTARWMGGAGIAIGALGLGVTLCYLAAFVTMTTAVPAIIVATP